MADSDHVVDFDELIGVEADFYGVDGRCFKLDEVIYEAIEDDNRLDEVRICHDKHSFHDLPIARVVIEESGEDTVSGYQLTDLHDGETLLCFGTEYIDTSERSYDTYFTFEYTPKAPPDND